MPKKFVENFFFQKKNFFCENEKLDYPRFLEDFYYHGTMILPCIREPTSIRNWVTFCGRSIINLKLHLNKRRGGCYCYNWKAAAVVGNDLKMKTEAQCREICYESVRITLLYCEIFQPKYLGS